MTDIPYWSPQQVAMVYGITRQTVYEWVRTGRLPAPTPHPTGMGSYWLASELPAAPSAAKESTTD